MTVDRRVLPLVATGVGVAYGATAALDGANVQVEAGEVLALTGPSGSGKSTLLHVLAGILRPDSGTVLYDGVDIWRVRESERAAVRLLLTGVLFQQADMVPELTLEENVALPLELLGATRRRARSRAAALLDDLGISPMEGRRRAGAVSGGEAQRAALARAIVSEPQVVFADEPTGALDSLNGMVVLEHLLRVRERGASVVLVTHDSLLAERADRCMTLRDGRLT